MDWLADIGLGYFAVDNVQEALEMVRQERADAVVYDAPILDYLVRSDPSGSLVVLDRRFDFQWYAFALPPNSEVTEKLNREILDFTSGEKWRKHVLKVIGRAP